MPERTYSHQEVEAKWSARWAADPTIFAAEPNSAKPKYYVLEMLP